MGDNSTFFDSESSMGDRTNGIPQEYPPKSYALSGKIMLSAIVILFTVVFLVICLHLYARWFLLRARRRQYDLRRRNRRTHLVFTTELPSNSGVVISSGLEASVLKSLPTFVFSKSTHHESLECAVCLSEFEENEKGRILPKCNHSFHIACIDMWFHSHSTCPICRSTVNPEIPEPVTENQNPVEIFVHSGESEPGTSSGLCPSCRHVEDEMGCASSSSSSNSNWTNPSLSDGSRRRGLDLVSISIEVPRRNESFKGLEEELQGFKSPGSRILALKRILSRERRPSTPSTPSMSCSSVTEIDLEKGKEEEEEEEREAQTRLTVVSSS